MRIKAMKNKLQNKNWTDRTKYVVAQEMENTQDFSPIMYIVSFARVSFSSTKAWTVTKKNKSNDELLLKLNNTPASEIEISKLELKTHNFSTRGISKV
jgi:hypothetical protein